MNNPLDVLTANTNVPLVGQPFELKAVTAIAMVQCNTCGTSVMLTAGGTGACRCPGRMFVFQGADVRANIGVKRVEERPNILTE